MNALDTDNISTAFNSILRADYISLDNIKELSLLEDYFIDYFGILNGLLQKQDNFISGRRGTGKTTNLLRGYYECLKSISPELKGTTSLLGTKKVLPIFIDLSTCIDIFDSRSDLELIEIHFIRQIIDSLKKQLALMYNEKHLILFKKENPALDDLDYIEKILVEGITISTSRKVEENNQHKHKADVNLSAKADFTKAEIGAGITDSVEKSTNSSHTKIKGLNVQDFLNKISQIKNKAKLDAIYIFLDEYSDLNSESQNKFSSLLKSFLGSRIGMFFKVGVITDRYDFGEKIIIGRDIFAIPLDFNEYVERFDGAIAGINKMQVFVEQLINKRIDKFCPNLKFTDIFKGNREEIFYRITRETLGVSRTIGIILQNAFIQARANSQDHKIGLAEINYGITCARKTYQKQFTGSSKKGLIPPFNMDIWNSIIEKALQEKNKFPDRAASHLMIDPSRRDYLNVLCENFMLHFISENVVSKHGGSYNLYAIDYDVCLENNIKYANKKDDYTPIRFIYDEVLAKYDPYFVKTKRKSYKCPACNKIYDETELIKVKIKRCFEDDEKLIEIIHQDAPVTHGNFAEVEIKILGLITQLTFDEAMTAREIADAVGCTRQKISAWGGRVLEREGHIRIDKNRKPHRYYASDLDESSSE
ncbi:hypothetical protein [Enterobacter hormaechei]|uniref:hypothetical protein n=1 Tax=Enterobacter hormaechei TaxID=158836 RepID=UPI003D6DFC97